MERENGGKHLLCISCAVCGWCGDGMKCKEKQMALRSVLCIAGSVQEFKKEKQGYTSFYMAEFNSSRFLKFM